MLTQARLKELLDYDKVTGIFTWNKKRRGRCKRGSVAGCPTQDGYIDITVDGIRYLAHRLAWLWVNGEFPEHGLDHINRIRDDNRIKNLRLATASENKQNEKRHRNNKSGIVGVSWNKEQQKWLAQIMVNGKTIYLGKYSTIEEASLARRNGKIKYHTFHPEDDNVEIP